MHTTFNRMHKIAPDPIRIIKQATGEKPTKCRHNHLSTVHICKFFEDSFDLLNITTRLCIRYHSFGRYRAKSTCYQDAFCPCEVTTKRILKF
jgi:hypothetical protein